MMKTMTKLGIPPAIVAGTFSLTALQLFGQTAEYAENVPLTYTQTSWQPGSLEPGDDRTEERFMTGARRSDGSTVRVRYERDHDGVPYEVRLIQDLESRRSVIVDSSLNSITTAVLEEAQIRSKRNRAACGGERSASMLGYDVILHTVSLPPMNQHDLRVETLVAPQLGCLVMEQKTVATSEDGTERTVMLDRVVRVDVGEPDDSLFSVPSDYIEMSPAERLKAGGGPDLNVVNDAFARRFEQAYQVRKPR